MTAPAAVNRGMDTVNATSKYPLSPRVPSCGPCRMVRTDIGEKPVTAPSAFIAFNAASKLPRRYCFRLVALSRSRTKRTARSAMRYDAHRRRVSFPAFFISIRQCHACHLTPGTRNNPRSSVSVMLRTVSPNPVSRHGTLNTDVRP